MEGTRAIDATPMIVARSFQNIASGITRSPSLPDSADGARACNSAGLLAANGRRRTPICAAAISALDISETEIALFGFAKTATVRAPGNACLSSCSRFWLKPVSNCVPVTLPPGRERLFASPSATGSRLVAPMTMGILRVASNAASVPLVLSVTITLTGMRTNSAASAGSASMIPFDRRKSSVIVCPLI